MCQRWAEILPILLYNFRQNWCPESEAGLLKTIVEHTAAELFDAATQDRYTTFVAVRVGIDCRAKQSQRWSGTAKAKGVSVKQR